MRKVVAILATLFMPAVAMGGEIVVLEAHPGPRPQDADRLLAPIYDEFALAGYLAGAGRLGPLVESRVSSPGLLLSADEAEDAIRSVEDGYAHFLAGDFEPAITTLTEAWARLRTSPATIAEDQARRDVVLKALVGLALAHKRLGHAEAATQAMAEVVRSFSDRPFNRAMFGPEGHDLWRKVKSELDAQGQGTLLIEVDDENAVIFLNERYDAVGRTRRELHPGRYRVYIQKGTTIGRLHEIDVVSGSVARMAVSWSFDSSLETRGWVGFAFASPLQQETLQGQYTTTAARALDASALIVLSIKTYQGRRAIVGASLSLDTGNPQRMAVLALEPVEPGPEQARGLARFLAGGERAPGLIVPGVGTPSDGPAHRERRFGTWKWLALGTGLAAVATGAVLVAVDEPKYDEMGSLNPQTVDTAGIGYVVGGIGVAALVAGGVLWWLDRDAEAAPTTPRAAIEPTAGGGVRLVLSGSF